MSSVVEFSATKKKILVELDRRKDEVITLLCDLIRIPSENPPGDTTEIASFLTSYLEKRRITVQRYETEKGMPNLVATIEGTKEKPNFVLNGHMDEFPAEVGKPWDFPPRAGEVRQGKIMGRGASDMKGGLTASLFAFTLIKDLEINLPGKLTLTLVSDEETGGRWGTEWLLNNVPDATGAACLSGEPTGLDSVGIGEKGPNWVKLKAPGIPAHGAYPYPVGGNAITKMAKALLAAQELEKLRGSFPKNMRKVIEDSKRTQERDIGRGAGRFVEFVTVNAGTISGGVKVNMVPGACEAELDIRAPIGVSTEQIRLKLESKLRNAGVGDVSCEFLDRNGASYTPPNDKLVKIVKKNVKLVTKKEPRLFIDPGASDLRFYMRRGIPSVVFGPRQHGMGAENEYIAVKDLLKVTQVHAGTIVDYFHLDEAGCRSDTLFST